MLAIILSPIYLFFHFYICRRFLRWLQTISPFFLKKGVTALICVVYALLTVTIGIGPVLPKSFLRRMIIVIGNYWLGVTIYMALIVLPFDIIGRICKVNRKQFIILGLVCLLGVGGTATYGVANSHRLHQTEYEITIEKDGGKLNELNAVLVADLHMGYNVGVGQIADMAEKIGDIDPDIIFLAGDIFDNDYDALDDPEKLIEIFRSLKPKYGIYACWGNHDIDEMIIAGFTFGWSDEAQEAKASDPRMDRFLEKAGITLLEDEGVLLEDSFYLYGRPDEGKSPERASAAEITAGMDLSKPVLVIDHEPSGFDELEKAGVDADFCGHTHDGQMFPMNLTGKLLWENPTGYLKKGNMHSIVTSGLGVFGPNMRVGTKAEICEVKILFE